MRTRLVVVVAGVLLASCGAPADDVAGSESRQTEPPESTTLIVEPDYGPFLASDPYGVVSGLEWLEETPALPGGPLPSNGPIAVIMDGSTPDVLYVAVNGGGCRPNLRLAVVQPPPVLELGISVGGYIAPPGLQCTDILTTHGFALRLNEATVLEDVVLNPMVSEGGRDVVVIQPATEAALPADVWLTCPSGPSFPAKTLDQLPYNLRTDLTLIDPPGVAEAMDEFLGSEEGQFWPQEGWRLLHRAEESVLVVHYDSDANALAFMRLKYEDGSWRWAGASHSGRCPLQIQMREGLGSVSWRIDPEAEPLNSDAASIPVLVNERACASGQPMGDRLVGPEVLMAESEVLIVFGVEPLSGAQTCQSNPEQRVVVELPEPLGDRVVRDGMDTGLDLADFLE